MSIVSLPLSVCARVTAASAVDSPEAVVKELIDNAIDAKSKAITVEIDNSSAGLEFICVSDDGTGIHRDSVERVCLQNTTSKLSKIEDLTGITTLGFRGEALHAIAALSRSITFTTKEEGAQMGTSWDVDQHGNVKSGSLHPSAAKRGTSVIVRGLFTRFPVRRKLMSKKESATHKAIELLVDTYSLVHDDIRFELKRVQISTKSSTSSGAQSIVEEKMSKRVLKAIVRLPHQHKPELLLGLKIDHSVPGSRRRHQQDQYVEGRFISSHSKFQVHYIFPLLTTVSTCNGGDFRASQLISTSSTSNQKIGSSVLPHLHGYKVISLNKHPLNVKLSMGKFFDQMIKSVYDELGYTQPHAWLLNFSTKSDLGLSDDQLGHGLDFNIEPKKDDCVGFANVLDFEELKLHIIDQIKSTHRKLGSSTQPKILVSTHIEDLPINLATKDKITSDDNQAEVENNDVDNIDELGGHELSLLPSVPGHGDSNVNETSHEHTTTITDMDQDEWSHAMHDNLSSETDHDITTSNLSDKLIPINEDFEVSKDINVSNPFTLAKLANSRTTLISNKSPPINEPPEVTQLRLKGADKKKSDQNHAPNFIASSNSSTPSKSSAIKFKSSINKSKPHSINTISRVQKPVIQLKKSEQRRRSSPSNQLNDLHGTQRPLWNVSNTVHITPKRITSIQPTITTLIKCPLRNKPPTKLTTARDIQNYQVTVKVTSDLWRLVSSHEEDDVTNLDVLNPSKKIVEFYNMLKSGEVKISKGIFTSFSLS